MIPLLMRPALSPISFGAITMATLESRSIEFIPDDERYGTAKRLFSIWFSSNVQVTTLVVGMLGVLQGLSVPWTCAALIIGNLIGTVFMAAHSAQGPHLGIPQMIQSRAQFGVLGAALPLFIVVLSYILFTAANGVLMRDSIKVLLPLGDDAAIIGFGAVTLAIAFFGYELIHRMSAVMCVLSGGVFMAAMYLLLTQAAVPHDGLSALAAAVPVGDAVNTKEALFKSATFMFVIAQAASWTLGFGPYVADYSRYLPASVSTRQTFWYTYIGNVLGSTSVMLIGAFMAGAISDSQADPSFVVANIAKLFGPFSVPVIAILIIGVLQINVLNLYSAYMSATTIFTGFRGARRIGQGPKFAIMALVAGLATWIALGTQYKFFEYFTDILVSQIYVLVPWSAINLVDYYFVRKGSYRVTHMYDVDGIYGRYNVVTLVVFLISVLAQLPFMDLSFYKGAAAVALGADISWIPALLVPASLYYILQKNRCAV